MANAMSEYFNLKARLVAQRERKQQEIAKINELLASLDEAREIVQDTTVTAPVSAQPYSLVEHVRKMLDSYGANDVITVGEMVAGLKKEGLHGKNLYNNVYTTLVREVRRNRLRHEKNVGFFKGKADDTVVATVGPKTVVVDRHFSEG